MSDEELIARLRKQSNSGRANHVSKADRLAAADRIEALIGEREVWKDRAMQVQDERDEALEWLSASQGYIADAVFALDKQEEAEAKLTKAVEALQWYADFKNHIVPDDSGPQTCDLARELLKEMGKLNA